MKVLIVDDEYYARKAILKCIEDSLKSCGVKDTEFFECDSAECALQLLEKTPLDLIFTDIRMGEFDGLSLCGVIYSQYPSIKTVIISGYAEFHYAKESINKGVFRFLVKPLDNDEIRSVLLDFLDYYSVRSLNIKPGNLSRSFDSTLLTPTYLDTISIKLIQHYLSSFKLDQLNELIHSLTLSMIKSGQLNDATCSSIFEEIIHFINDTLKDFPNIHIIPFDIKPLKGLETVDACKIFLEKCMEDLKNVLRNQMDYEDPLEKKLIKYINDNYSENLNLNLIAKDVFFVHQNYLSKLLKDTVGLSFSKYLLEVRMKNAISLLKHKDLSIATIAQMVGYNSESYFVQVFRQYFGETPGSYRK